MQETNLTQQEELSLSYDELNMSQPHTWANIVSSSSKTTIASSSTTTSGDDGNSQLHVSPNHDRRDDNKRRRQGTTSRRRTTLGPFSASPMRHMFKTECHMVKVNGWHGALTFAHVGLLLHRFNVAFASLPATTEAVTSPLSSTVPTSEMYDHFAADATSTWPPHVPETPPTIQGGSNNIVTTARDVRWSLRPCIEGGFNYCTSNSGMSSKYIMFTLQETMGRWPVLSPETKSAIEVCHEQYIEGVSNMVLVPASGGVISVHFCAHFDIMETDFNFQRYWTIPEMNLIACILYEVLTYPALLPLAMLQQPFAVPLILAQQPPPHANDSSMGDSNIEGDVLA